MLGAYVCSDCGCAFPANLRALWGRTRETDGYGPRPRCCELVPNPDAPRAPDGSIPLQVCGCELGFDPTYDPESPDAPRPLLELHPITAR